MKEMFVQLEEINKRPAPFEFYTAADLWTDEHTSEQMLSYHLNSEVDLSSRRKTFIERSVEWIAVQFDVDETTRIADFGCGPGLYTNRFAQRGAQVTGIDFSKRSIEYASASAAENGLTVDYLHQNYLEFESEVRFDLILMIFCDFCALSPSQRRLMLEKFHSLLSQDGSVLLDVYSLNAFAQLHEEASYEMNLLDGFWSASPYYGFLNRFKYEEEKVLLDKYTIVEAERTRTVFNWLQYFSPDALRTEFTEAGFTQYEVHGDVAGSRFDPGNDEFAVVVQK